MMTNAGGVSVRQEVVEGRRRSSTAGIKDVLLNFPATQKLKSLLRMVRMRYCRGVFGSYEAAAAALPANRLVGYDNEESSKLYIDGHGSLKPTDYAIFHWLAPLLATHPALFDFGGHVGRLYYSYEKYLSFSANFRWVVCDLPAVVETGRAIAVERAATHLEFTTEFQEAEEYDILFTSGTLQYLDKDLATLLGGLRKLPTHLLINRVPLSEFPTWFTIQDYGTAVSAYRIENRSGLVASLERLGYRQVDSWECYESVCRVLFRPRRRVRPYAGMYFRLTA